MSKKSRRLLTVGIAALTAFTMVGCSTPDGGSEEPAAETFKLGVIGSYKGGFAIAGSEVIDKSVRLFLDQNDNKLGDMDVEVVFVDGETDPGAYVTKIRQLVEQDEVDAIVGVDHSGGALAVRDYLDENKVPTLITVAAARPLTNDLKSDYIFRVSYTEGQMEPVGAALAYDGLGWRNIAVMASDYPGAVGTATEFQDAFIEAGGTVATFEKPPLGAADLSSYFSKIQAISNLDGIVPIMFGADATRFIEQYSTLGLEAGIMSVGNFAEQTLALDAWGDLALGTHLYWHYSSGLDNATNKAFVEAYSAANGRLPGGLSATTYGAMQILNAAVSASGTTDPDQLAAAIGQVSMEIPLGDISFDDRHAMIFDVYLNQVQDSPNGPVQVSVGPVVRQVNQDMTLTEAYSRLESNR